MRRVVVTGLGIVSPIGSDIETVKKNLREGYSGIDYIKNFDSSKHKVKLAAEVRGLNEEDYIDKKQIRRMDRVNRYGLIAAKKAVEDSGLRLEEIDPLRAGVSVSSGIGGLESIENEHAKGLERGFDKVSAFFIPMAIANLTASYIAIEFGLHGDCNCPVTACAGGTTALGQAFNRIRYGMEDLILAGGSEASVTPLGIGGFTAMRALSESSDPKRASIPFDRDRSGFVMGEGAGILVLEELDHALKRGARIYGEILGYGSSSDASHITAPNQEGYYAALAMEKALKDAGLKPEDIAYINCHGTSTALNDKCEVKAIKKAFGSQAYSLNISSSKSMTGHLLGASGAVEAIFTILAMDGGFIPATINFKNKDEDCDLDITANQALIKEYKYSLSNSLGFGGHNASIVLKRWRD